MCSSMRENESNVEISSGVEEKLCGHLHEWMLCVHMGVPVKSYKYRAKHRAWGSGRWSGYKVLFDTDDACCWAGLA